MNRAHLWDAAFKMLNAPSGDKVPEVTLKTLQAQGFTTTGHPTMRSYGAYLRRFLVLECKGPRPEFPQDIKKLVDPIESLTEKLTV